LRSVWRDPGTWQGSWELWVGSMAQQFLKRRIRRALHRFGFDLRRIEGFGVPNLIDFLVSRRIDMVLDVGANVGQFACGLRANGYQGDIVSFEPIPEIFDRLKSNANKDSKWVARRTAIGAVSGTASIKVSAETVFTSFMAQSSLGERFSPGTAVVRMEEVKVVTIDEIFEPFRERSVFLKIDVQGFERQVLDGTRDALKLLKGVQLELPIMHLYQNTWRFSEAVNYMDTAGFILSQIAPVVFNPSDHVSLVEVDCVFRRRGPQDD
jgi:FkbM family methyltransferase